MFFFIFRLILHFSTIQKCIFQKYKNRPGPAGPGSAPARPAPARPGLAQPGPACPSRAQPGPARNFTFSKNAKIGKKLETKMKKNKKKQFSPYFFLILHFSKIQNCIFQKYKNRPGPAGPGPARPTNTHLQMCIVLFSYACCTGDYIYYIVAKNKKLVAISPFWYRKQPCAVAISKFWL